MTRRRSRSVRTARGCTSARGRPGTPPGSVHADLQRRHPVRRLHLEVPVGRSRAASSRSCTGTTGGTGAARAPVDPERIDIAAHADDLGQRAQARGRSAVRARRALDGLPGRARGLPAARPRRCARSCSCAAASGNVTSTFHGVPCSTSSCRSSSTSRRSVPDVVRAVWTRLPPQLALKIALQAGEIDPERVHAEDMLPYLSHMTHVDFPMFLRMLRAAGEHTAGDLLAADRRAGARHRGRARHVHAGVSRARRWPRPCRRASS